MNAFLLKQKTPREISLELVKRIQKRRRALKMSQKHLAEKSGVSLGSIKRFETKYEISLTSLIKIAIALDLDREFDTLFTQKTYNSIDEIINRDE